jgi:hypothetical protein
VGIQQTQQGHEALGLAVVRRGRQEEQRSFGALPRELSSEHDEPFRAGPALRDVMGLVDDDDVVRWRLSQFVQEHLARQQGH